MVYNTRSHANLLKLKDETIPTKTYNTMNVSNYTELEVNIDFNHASKEWRKNKIQLKEGMFRYIQK